MRHEECLAETDPRRLGRRSGNMSHIEEIMFCGKKCAVFFDPSS